VIISKYDTDISGRMIYMAKILYLVIPCYNEEEVLADTAGKLDKKMKELMAEGLIDVKSRIIFVNDGSMDLTWKIIEDLHNKDTLFGGINLTRNRGHQNALLAGLMTVKDDADIVISLDADLQDDINVFEEMLRKNNEGYDVVYGVRNDRKKDSFFKRHTAQMFYKLTNKLGGDLIYNHADFRLMSRRALEGLAQFEEVNLFLRGIVPLIGYPSTIVEYERKERLAGKSKYPLRKMMSFAIEGITSLSIKPMRFVTGMGIFVFLVSIAMMIYAFVSYFTGRVVAGWTSILISVWAIGGMVLLGLGIVGSYIGKIYLETKKRPRYIVEKYINERE
jgi:glycosyltransferase involved in cell wall biosynthesis